VQPPTAGTAVETLVLPVFPTAVLRPGRRVSPARLEVRGTGGAAPAVAVILDRREARARAGWLRLGAAPADIRSTEALAGAVVLGWLAAGPVLAARRVLVTTGWRVGSGRPGGPPYAAPPGLPVRPGLPARARRAALRDWGPSGLRAGPGGPARPA